MARYLMHVRTPMPPEEAFDYMADLRNFAEWDPGVDHVEQIEGDGPGPRSSFDVAVKAFGRSITLRYDVVTYQPPATVVAFAQSRLLTSRDTITVEPDGSGSLVTYDAVLKLPGLLGLADPLLGLSFKRIGDRAGAGLVAALSGERVAEPTMSKKRRSVVVGTVIDRSPTEVWADVRNIESHVTWMQDAAAIRFLSESHEGAGTRFECDTKVGPFSLTDVMEITSWEDERRMGVRHVGLVEGTGEFTLTAFGPDRGRTEFRWEEDLTFPWFMGGPVGAFLARPVLRWVWKGNLKRLKARIEAARPSR